MRRVSEPPQRIRRSRSIAIRSLPIRKRSISETLAPLWREIQELRAPKTDFPVQVLDARLVAKVAGVAPDVLNQMVTLKIGALSAGGVGEGKDAATTARRARQAV